MATVLERFKHLGLAHNNKILMIVGTQVAQEYYHVKHLYPRIRITQVEDGQLYDVWNYPEAWAKEMDRIIINFLDHYLQDDYDFIQSGGK